MGSKTTARQNYKAAQRRAVKWLRKISVQEVCPVCGADLRDRCDHVTDQALVTESN
jgi:hypothetical protein